ncbi:MAG TPA: DUF5668 domain-containing protein [Chryseosolibacter sp.]|nr:DUF5668 domain-containing protein [Chryseosolibacter sp.]
MESYNQNKVSATESKNSFSGRVFGGIVLIIIGALFLLKKSGMDIPYWFFSWELIFIAVGIFLGIRHSFRGPLWLIFVLIGSTLLVDDLVPDMDFDRYLWPIIIIAVGLVMIVRPQRKKREEMPVFTTTTASSGASTQEDEVIDSVTILGGIKRNIISKNFKGGEAVTILGGTELNLSQADTQGVIVLELTQIFGGTKLIVPPHWKILSDDLVCILGGLDDKRPIYQQTGAEENQRVVIIKGTCIFGGIDIKSF